MSATLTTAPATRAFTRQPIWAEITTDLLTGVAGYFEITIADGGPSDTQTLTLTWPGGSITYTAATSPDGTGLQWPLQGATTLESYTNAIAEVLRHREDVAEVFTVSIEDAPGGVIRLTHSAVEDFDLVVTTDTMTNVAVTATDGAAHPEENLRAYVEVWTDTGDFNTEERLLDQHSPYDANGETWLDLAPAFSHLAPHLPDDDTINPAAPASLDSGEASGHFQKYFLRIADKYGTPAVSEALLRSDNSYLAILGARATDAETGSTILGLRHAYRRRDGEDFIKPVGEYQPDWVYYIPSGGKDVYVTLDVYWSDGTASAYDPFGTTTTAIADGKIYWFPSGYRQMKLHNLAPSGSTDADAYIVAYDWKLKPADAVAIATVKYRLEFDSPWEHYLLFSNGVGGMETVFLRGKFSEGFEASAETFRLPRQHDHTVQRGDFDAFAQEGRPQWTFSTGWYDDPYYVEHLRQVLLSQAWLVDRFNRAFLKVIIDPKETSLRNDDETLYALEFSAKAGWIDAAVNI